VEYANEFRLEAKGRPKELRQRLAAYLRSTEHTEAIKERLAELAVKTEGTG